MAAALTGGCTTITPIDVGGTAPVAGWNAETRALAGRSWLYAQLSINAYLDYEAFTLPGDVVQREPLPSDAVGYDFVVFDRYEGDAIAETIIAYRGTEPNAADWVLGNVIGLQNDRGLATAVQLFAQMQAGGRQGVPLTVTGHSLGGGIAHHVTDHPISEEGDYVTRSLVFNNAPRFSGFENDSFDRTAVVERGDWLGPLRALGNAPPNVTFSLDCQPGFDPTRDHSMRDLAACLTWIAAFDDPAARLSLLANPGVGRPAAQTLDMTPSAADAIGTGVPVNAHVDDPALASAVDARLRESPVLSPFYAGRVGYRLDLSAPLDGKVEAVWWRNGVRQLVALVDCAGALSAECADRVIVLGEGLVTAQLEAVDGD